MSDHIVIDTPDGINHYYFAATIGALKLEVNTGMKMGRGSLIKVCQDNYGCPKKTKAGALEWMLNLYKETYGREYGAK